jgi:chromosome segregation ATPase
MEKGNSEDQGRELAHLRSQLQSGTQRIASLQTELEKERKRSEGQAQGSTYLTKQLQDKTSKSELQMQRTASLETKLEEAKLRLEEKGLELAKQAKDRAAENEAHLQHVAYLEMELKESKKMLEAQAQESTRLRKEAQDKTTSDGFSANQVTAPENELTPVKMRIKAFEGRLHAQRFPSLETDLMARKQRSEQQTQGSDFSPVEVQGLASQCESLQKNIVPLEQELRSRKNRPSRPVAPVHQAQPSSPPAQPPSRRGSLYRTGTPLNHQRTALPANQSMRFSASNVSQSNLYNP